MRRPQLSTGAWLFCGIVAAASIAPAGVYAAVNSRVAIGNPGDAITATVTAQHQLMTAVAPADRIIRIHGGVNNQCKTVYTPPAGKALVLLSATVVTQRYVENSYVTVAIEPSGCDNANWSDLWVTAADWETQQHTYPGGLPLPSLLVNVNGGTGFVSATGYLISASQLPSAVQGVTGVQVPKPRR